MNEVFSPVKPKKVADEIVKQFKALIFEGKLKPGEKLPPERDLAKSLNVSRVSLREALNILQSMGLLEIQQGNRSYVRPITTRSIYDPLVSFVKSSPYKMIQLLEIRKYLEIGCVSLAAERASDDEIDQLEKITQIMKEDLENDRLGNKADLDFHHLIADATHNQAYVHVMNTIYDLLQDDLRVAAGGIFRNKSKRQKNFQQHMLIFQSIKEKDPQKGGKAAADHLSFVVENWVFNKE